MSNKIKYITTPLYYVNGNPHIGHAYTTILGDVLNRYGKLFQKETFFLTGTDEHGQKVQQAAIESNKTPKEYCDELTLVFKSLWSKLNIQYDYFIRTTDDYHVKAVKEVLDQLYQKGDIYLDEYDGWYCTPCERFWTEKDLEQGKCPDCGREVQQIREKNYFFKMSRYQDWLIDHIHKNPKFIVPEYRKNEVLGFLRNQLNDLCVSRPKSRLTWGIELPFDSDYVCYVWFDALLNYVTGPGFLRDEKQFKKIWPADYHLIGKDILTTHAVYWPIMLKSLDIEPPKSILAHGWWLVEQTKMSKSRGNIIQPLDLMDKYGVDEFRYFLMKEMTLGQDSNFSEESFIDKINSDLANDLGNLANRINKMTLSYLQGNLKKPKIFNDIDNELIEKCKSLNNLIPSLYDDLKLNLMLEEIMNIIRSVNRYLEMTAPWKMSKENDLDSLNRTLYTANTVLCAAGLLLKPVMPDKINRMLNFLGIRHETNQISEIIKIFEQEEYVITKANPLFPRIDKAEIFKEKDTRMEIKEEKKESQETQEAHQTEKEKQISIDHFFETRLVVAEIISAEKIEKADKLLRLIVNNGEKEKQIVAGIAKFYSPEELPGKKIIIVDNLKPVKLRGVLSEGMILAVESKDGGLSFVKPEKDTETGKRLS